MTQIQDLRSRIVLLKRRVIEEKDGLFTEIWEEGDSVWAQVVPCPGREAFGEEWNNLATVQSKYKVILRFRTGQFERVKWEQMTLALMYPPLIDQGRQWMACQMYVVGERDE